MKLFEKNLKREKVKALFLSILIHAILIFILAFIKIEYSQVKGKKYLDLNFVEIKPEENKKVEKKIEPEKKIKNVVSDQKKETVKIRHQKVETHISTEVDTTYLKEVVDTTSNREKIYITKSQLEDTTYRSLKFAATLLDSFLVRHPEYGKYILEQQAKELVENKKIKKFSRLALERRINEELDKYLKEHYPEGSEHEINPYTGPGFLIPIDDLIDAIKKIF